MAEDTQSEKAPERFTVEDMIARSSARFDQPSYVMVGALHDFHGVTLTEAEAKKRLDAFLKREVT